jgi:hypothetical protein
MLEPAWSSQWAGLAVLGPFYLFIKPGKLTGTDKVFEIIISSLKPRSGSGATKI